MDSSPGHIGGGGGGNALSSNDVVTCDVQVK